MEFSKVEKQIFNVASFLDGLTEEIPEVDFIEEYNILKTRIIQREFFTAENFVKLYKLIEAMEFFAIQIETRNNKIDYQRYDSDKISNFISQFDFFRDSDEPKEFIRNHFPEIIEESDGSSSCLRYLTDIIYTNNEEDDYNSIEKFTWKGTPAQLAFVINLFQEKGYIDSLTPFGERNAKILLDHFNIDGYNSTPQSLGRCFQQLKKDMLPINTDDASKFLKIPKRVELKK